MLKRVRDEMLLCNKDMNNLKKQNQTLQKQIHGLVKKDQISSKSKDYWKDRWDDESVELILSVASSDRDFFHDR